MSDTPNDDLIEFADEPEPGPADSQRAHPEPWRVLIVDDEEQVHQATRYALQECRVLGRPLAMDSVYSGTEAREVLTRETDYACMFLDVVMEREDAGLALVGFLRETLGNAHTRIILRTGQPGYAPEVEVVQHYDINDYKAKSELTRNKLLTTLTAAIRSYEQIRTIEENRRGLEMIIDGASSLFRERSVQTFARGAIIQLCSLLHIEEDGFLCCHYASEAARELRVLAASGNFADFHGRAIDELDDHSLKQELSQTLASKQSRIDDTRVILYMVSPNGDELVAHVTSHQPFSELDLKLLEVFSVNIAVGFNNAHMFEEMERLAFVDQLTGLPNRQALVRSLQRRMEADHRFVMVLADLDNFQAVTDGLGREIGDQALLAVTGRMNEFFGRDAMVSRVGGDSFCWVMTEPEKAESRLQEGLRALSQGFSVGGYELPISFTMGLVHCPDHGSDAETLLQNASIALKQAKATQKASFCWFNEQFEEKLQRRLTLASQLRFAVTRQELEVHFQPQLRLKGRQIMGAEALLRWRPEGGDPVSPGEFIPVAESTGNIVEIGAWVLEEACRAQQAWQQASGRELTVAVNLSLRQLRDGEFLAMLDDTLSRTGMNPRNLELEVTESLMMSDTDLLTECLTRVRQRGIQVAIDDFGTGYSSLSYLQQLPVDRLKIDRSFVDGLHTRVEEQRIASLIIELGHLLRLQVLAEGVENQQQENQLRRLHCDEVQGFFYAYPMVQEEFLKLLSDEHF